MLPLSCIKMLSVIGGGWDINGPRKSGTGMAHAQHDLELFDVGNVQYSSSFLVYCPPLCQGTFQFTILRATAYETTEKRQTQTIWFSICIQERTQQHQGFFACLTERITASPVSWFRQG